MRHLMENCLLHRQEEHLLACHTTACGEVGLAVVALVTKPDRMQVSVESSVEVFLVLEVLYQDELVASQQGMQEIEDCRE